MLLWYFWPATIFCTLPSEMCWEAAEILKYFGFCLTLFGYRAVGALLMRFWFYVFRFNIKVLLEALILISLFTVDYLLSWLGWSRCQGRSNSKQILTRTFNKRKARDLCLENTKMSTKNVTHEQVELPLHFFVHRETNKGFPCYVSFRELCLTLPISKCILFDPILNSMVGKFVYDMLREKVGP